jgi:restriction system protein
MDSSRTVTAFTNYVTPDLLSSFVGREAELGEIRGAVARGARGVLIVGPAGSGKTSVARVFAARHDKDFSGGIFTTSASWPEGPDHLLARALPPRLTGTALLILDDAEALGESGLQLLQQALLLNPALRVILTSRRLLTIPERFHTILLPPGLSKEEFAQLLRLRNAFAHGALDDRSLTRLFNAGGGSALFANLAVSAVQQGPATSWDDLLEHLRGFRTPGLVGPDGRALSRDSEQYNRVVVDVSSVNDELLRLLKRQPEAAWKLPSRKFEEIVAEILSKQGYDVTLTPASGDGGFDIYAARKDGLGKFLYLVECKRYVPPNKVGVEVVRSLYGVVQTQRATAGAIVTTSFFTNGAEQFQREVQHQLHLHDYIVLQKWIHDFPLAKEEPTRPLCG